jgi:hypothetical protein
MAKRALHSVTLDVLPISIKPALYKAFIRAACGIRALYLPYMPPILDLMQAMAGFQIPVAGLSVTIRDLYAIALNTRPSLGCDMTLSIIFAIAKDSTTASKPWTSWSHSRACISWSISDHWTPRKKRSL